MEPIVIEIDTPNLVTAEDAVALRRLHGMDALDQRKDLLVHLVIGPNSRKASESFITALMQPSFEAGRSFGFQFPKALVRGFHEQAGNYVLVVERGYAKARLEAGFHFHHIASNLAEAVNQPCIMQQLIAEDLQSPNPKRVGHALETLHRHQKLSDFWESVCKQSVEDDNAAGDASHYGFRHNKLRVKVKAITAP